MSIHILHTPMKEVHRERVDPDRWCFKCRKMREFHHVAHEPADTYSHYGPSRKIECSVCHLIDGDLFPGRSREWGDEW